MIGTGYVGLVSGTCFSEFGTEVVCVDKDEAKIERLQAGEIPIFEPGLDQLVNTNCRAGRLSFTTDLALAVSKADAVFIAVGTPTSENGESADLANVFAVVRQVAAHLQGYTVIVTKSTVPVGTGRQVAAAVREVNPEADFDVVSNPEFLREGSAINDFIRPDRVVIGAETDSAREIMRVIYRPLYLIETPILFTSLETAELTKYAANAFLAMKISFINEIADLCEHTNADVHHVARGIGLDGRIGPKFLHPGPGYGGSCFPKDTMALAHTARNLESPVRIIETVIAVNETRKRAMADKIVAHCGGSVAGKTLAVLGVTFKPNTDDMRDSPSLVILPLLLEQGAKLQAYDPEGMTEAAKLIDGVTWIENAYEAVSGADALVLLTEWNEFRALDLERIKSLLNAPVVIDLRNIYDPTEMAEAGFSYTSLGRPPRVDRQVRH